jgi:hypothetical protein
MAPPSLRSSDRLIGALALFGQRLGHRRLRRERRAIRDSGRPALLAQRRPRLRESHPHDVFITKEAPNYGVGRR